MTSCVHSCLRQSGRCTHGDWGAVESAIGLRLPSDYKAFIGVYGSGLINGCLEVRSPFGARGEVRQCWLSWASLYRDIAKYVEVPYGVFPQTDGLLPFGTLGDVNFLNWLTIAEPDGWPFVYYDRVKGFFEIKGLTAVEFLLEAVTQRSPLPITLGDDSVFGPACDFEAYTPEPRYAQFIHASEIALNALADRLASRWPADQVRIRRGEHRVKVLAEPLAGSVSVSREGDERTWVWLEYDQSCAPQADAVSADLLTMGFTLIGKGARA